MTVKLVKQVGFICAISVLILYLTANLSALFLNQALWIVPVEVLMAISVLLFFSGFIYLKKKEMATPNQEILPRKPSFDVLRNRLGNPPNWVFRLSLGVYVYGLLCALLWTSTPQMPYFDKGKYQLTSRGHTTYYSESEGKLRCRAHIIGESGVPIIFILFPILIFFPKKEDEK